MYPMIIWVHRIAIQIIYDQMTIDFDISIQLDIFAELLQVISFDHYWKLLLFTSCDLIYRFHFARALALSKDLFYTFA